MSIKGITIGIDGLAGAIENILEEYNEDVKKGMKKAAKETADEAVQELHKGGSYQRGAEYNAGWTTKTQGGSDKVNVIVYNANSPQLAHLLEKGHALWQGGRARAFPHIKPVEEKAKKDFEEKVKEVIERG